VDTKLVKILLLSKLRDRGTYVLALFVGSLINLYGQLLVPWLRGVASPFSAFTSEFMEHTTLTLFSISLGYVFPFCVGIYSAVVTRYRNRRMESIADFPDRKPDPVFRVNQSGELIEAGAVTRELFERNGLENAEQILGNDIWQRILKRQLNAFGEYVQLKGENARYIVSYAEASSGDINIYMARMPA
jgi:hypothetical protein